jgi:hypothetical protein
MPTAPRQVPVVSQPDAAKRRQPIHGIKMMPSGYDAEVAELFRDLRAATALSEMDLAARIGTRPDVVQALEQGALHALPPWAETCRVVNAYGTMLNLDVRPLLRRIYAQLEAGIVELQPKPMLDVPTMTPPDSDDFGFGTGSAANTAPNPLDIPWPPAQQPPQPQAQPQRPQWPNAGPAPAPQPRRPNADPFPQPQSMRPQPQGAPHPSQAWPGGPAPMPQASRPPAPAQRPAPPQAPVDRRPPPPRAPQPQAVQPRQPAAPEPEFLEEAYGSAAPQPAPEPETKRGRSGMLKWAIIALAVAAVVAGLGLLYVYAPGSAGLSAPESGPADPDDPRSKKTDRLPETPPPPPPAQ